MTSHAAPPATTVKETRMKEYTVDIGGVEHTMLLDDADAKRLRGKAAQAKKAPAPLNKASKPAANKS